MNEKNFLDNKSTLIEKGIEELNLSEKTYNRLKKAQINTIKDLITRKDTDLIKIKGFGGYCLFEAEKKLSVLGLRLNMNPNKESTQIREKKIEQNINNLLELNLQELGFSVWLRRALNSKKIFKLKELVTKTEAELLSIKYFDKNFLREIKYILEKLGLQLNMNIEEHKTVENKENLNSIDSSYKIDAEEKEINKKKEAKDDITKKGIEELELSIRSYHCLKKIGINNIGELIEKKESDLLQIKNFGVTSLKNVKNALDKYNLRLNIGLVDEKLYTSSPEEYFNTLINEYLTELDFSIRAINCFNENNILQVKDLITKTENDLLALKNFGKTCLNETKSILKQKGLHLNMEIREPYKEKNNIPLLIGSKFEIDKSEIEGKNFHYVKVNNLSLSKRAKNVLENMNVENLSELINMPYYTLLAAKNCGKNTAYEIRETVTEYINSEENLEPCTCIYDWLIYVRNRILEKDNLEKILSNHKYIEVFRRRYGIGRKIETLESIGADLSLTRERIRQISQKSINKIFDFIHPNYKEYLDYFISEFYNNHCLLPYEGNDIFINTKEFSLFNSILSLLDKTITFDEKFKLWRKNNFNFLDKIGSFLDKNCQIGKKYELSEIAKLIEKFADKFHIPTKLLSKINNIVLSKFFREINNIYFYKRIIKSSVSSEIIKSHFPNGISLYKNADEFINAAKKEGLGYLFDNMTERALIGLISNSDDIILWDWGIYIHRDNIHIDYELMKKVSSWINKRFELGISKVSLWGAFVEFKDECIKRNIPNEHALYSCMKISYGNRFAFLNDPYVYPKKSKQRIKKQELLEDFLRERKKSISLKEIQKSLGLKEYQVAGIIDSSDKLIFLGGGTYIHQNNLNINKNDFNHLENFIERELALHDYISIEYIFKKNIVICKKNSINDSYELYNILAHFKDDDYYFPRFPHIVNQKGIIEDDGRFSFNDIINHFFLSKESIVYRKQLYQYFVKERGYKERFIDAIPKFCEDIIKYTNSSFISLETINWSEKKNEELQKIALDRFHKDCSLDKPYSLITDLLEENLPKINDNIDISWQKTLLKELLERQNNIKILGTLDEVYIAVPNEKNIKSIEDLMYFILLNKFNGAANIDEFVEYLKKSRISSSLILKYLDDRIKVSNKEIFINPRNDVN